MEGLEDQLSGGTAEATDRGDTAQYCSQQECFCGRAPLSSLVGGPLTLSVSVSLVFECQPLSNGRVLLCDVAVCTQECNSVHRTSVFTKHRVYSVYVRCSIQEKGYYH